MKDKCSGHLYCDRTTPWQGVYFKFCTNTAKKGLYNSTDSLLHLNFHGWYHYLLCFYENIAFKSAIKYDP